MRIFGYELKKQINFAPRQGAFGYANKGQVTWMPGDPGTLLRDGYGNDIVYSVMKVLINKQTEAPLLVSKVVDEKSHARYKSFLKADTPSATVALWQFREKAFEDIDSGGYGTMFDLLKNPNEDQTSSEFWENFWLYYNLVGESFIYALTAGSSSDNVGKPTELHVLPPNFVSVVYSGNPLSSVVGYKFNIGDFNIDIPKEKIMHLKRPNPTWDNTGGQLRGYGPLVSGRKRLTKNNLNQEAQASAMQNGGSVTLLHGNPDKSKMSVEQMDKMDAMIKEKIKGAKNYGNIVMTNGYLEAQKIGDTITDMNLIQADQEDIKRIASWWGVDSILIGSKEGSTESNVKAAYKSLVTNVVVSDLVKRDEKITKFLNVLYKDKLVCRADTTVFTELAPDLELMFKIFGRPLLTENQKLGLFGWGESKDPNMDKVYIQSGYTTLDALNSGELSNEDY